MKTYFILFIGIIACATSIVFIKKSDIHPIYLASYRTLLAAICLLPIALLKQKSNQQDSIKYYLKISFIPGLLLAIHFISWIYGARMTLAANSSLIVNLTPLVTPFILYFLVKETLLKKEIIGTLVAISGVFILGVSDAHIDFQFLLGDIICFFSMIAFAYYLVYGRKNKNCGNHLLYVCSLYLWCGIICFMIGLILFIHPFHQLDKNNIIQICYLAFITTIIGHSILNYAMRHIRGQVVSLINQGQFIPGAIFGFIFLYEIPTLPFYLASLLLICGVYITINKKAGSKIS